MSMEIPNSISGAWNKAIEDKQITKEEFEKDILGAAISDDGKIDDTERAFLSNLKSKLVDAGIATKGKVPVSDINFGETKKTADNNVPNDAKVVEKPTLTVKEGKIDGDKPILDGKGKVEGDKRPMPDDKARVEGNKVSVGENKSTSSYVSNINSIQIHSSSINDSTNVESPANYVNIANTALPVELMSDLTNEVPVLLSQQVNPSFAEESFGTKSANGALPDNKVTPILEAFGAGTVKQLQQTVGANQTERFDPETYFKTKTYVATKINDTQNVSTLGKLKDILNTLGNDSEVSMMKTVVDKRIDTVENAKNDRESLQNCITNTNNIVAKADPNSVKGLLGAKVEVNNEFKKLPTRLQDIPQVIAIQKQAIEKLDGAIGVARPKLEQLLKDVNSIVTEAVKDGLTTGKLNKLNEAKTKIDEVIAKSDLKNTEDAKEVKSKSTGIIDSTIKVINDINGLIDKAKWTKDDMDKAKTLVSQLPDGDLKTRLQKAIEKHSGNIVTDNNSGNNSTPINYDIKTTLEGLHDVIGNGFFNLQNTDGTKAMFQLIAKQGVMSDAIKKMTVEDQTRAINILADKGSSSFDLAIAKKIYDNLNSSANVDKDIDKKALSSVKASSSVENFESFKIDDKTYANGLIRSISSDTLLGHEVEAALTMARGIMNGEVSKSVLGKLNSYDIESLAKFIEKKGSANEKGAYFQTLAKAYNEDVPVSIESLNKEEKAQIVKETLSIPNINESKLDTMVKKAGKWAIFETVRNQNLNDSQLATLGKHVDGDQMADKPDVGAKILVSMIKTFNKQEEVKPETKSLELSHITKYVDDVDKDWFDDDDVMRIVLSQLGDGPGSEYAKFNEHSPATLGKMWKISD